jgi:hypothetical protein
VLHDVFSHSSIAATILRRFCSPHPPYMSARVAAAHDLRGAISLTRGRNLPYLFHPPVLVSTPTPSQRLGLAGTAPLDAGQALMGAIRLIVGGSA